MTDENEQEDRPTVDLERRSRDDAAAEATNRLSNDLLYSAASYVVRAGLGPHFLNAAGPDGSNVLDDPTPEEIGALLSIPFKPDEDPLQDDLRRYVLEQASGGVVLEPEEAREIADHLADYDITARLSRDEDDRPEEAVEWGRELRHRARDAREEDR